MPTVRIARAHLLQLLGKVSFYLSHSPEILTQKKKKKSEWISTRSSSWFLLCSSFLNPLVSVGPSSFDRNTFEQGVSCHGSLKSLHVCMFLVSPQSLSSSFFFLLFLLLGTEYRNQSSFPLRHIKQSLVPTTVSFVFPLWLSSCFSAGQQINTDLGEKRACFILLS